MTVQVIEDNLEQVEEALRQYASTFASQEEAAQSLEVSRVFLWKMLNRKKPISKAVLDKLGFQKTTIKTHYYRKL